VEEQTLIKSYTVESLKEQLNDVDFDEIEKYEKNLGAKMESQMGFIDSELSQLQIELKKYSRKNEPELKTIAFVILVLFLSLIVWFLIV
jgi:hypothetical protein